MKYAFIQQHQDAYRIQRLCQVLGVSRSGYYAWLKRPSSKRDREDGVLLSQIEQVHSNAHRIYGSRRVHAKLMQQGVVCSLHKVRRLMRQRGLMGVRRQRRPHTTTPFPGVLPFMNNQLNRNLQATQANTKWVADITYIDTREGYLYLAAILDLYSRKIVGWAMENHLRESLVEQALLMALEQRCPPLDSCIIPIEAASMPAMPIYWRSRRLRSRFP
jgi:putative transposase